MGTQGNTNVSSARVPSASNEQLTAEEQKIQLVIEAIEQELANARKEIDLILKDSKSYVGLSSFVWWTLVTIIFVDSLALLSFAAIEIGISNQVSVAMLALLVLGIILLIILLYSKPWRGSPIRLSEQSRSRIMAKQFYTGACILVQLSRMPINDIEETRRSIEEIKGYLEVFPFLQKNMDVD